MLESDYDSIRRYLLAVEQPAAEREAYRLWVDLSLPRLLRTLGLVPQGGKGQRCLEIGSKPYTMTLLMRKFRDYELDLINYSSTGQCPTRETLTLPAYGETHELVSDLRDVEHEPLPFPAARFDGVLCCELLEHLIADPLAMLSEIQRVLRPEGWLILTTPNVANIGNILHLIHGRNVYHPYERVFGPTWRHNREYTPREVVDLLEGTGFVVNQVIVEDTAAPGLRRPLSQRVLQRILQAWYRIPYGHQLYVRARRGSTFRPYYPSWLFAGEDRVAALAGYRLEARPPKPR